MEVAEISPQTGVSKSSTSMSESSHEVSVEKTATGSIEQESSLQRSVEQSVEKSVQQQSSHVVQKSVQSSVSAQSETETITSSTTSTTKSTDVPSEIKQDSIKNTLKEIISDIDRVIEQEEEQEQRQEQLSQPKEEELEKQQPLRQQSFQLQPSQIGPQIISSSTEKTNEVSGYTTKNEVIERSEVKEPKAPGPKPVVDLQKIFTPAADADEILPQKNRKLYASSAFYSPTLHPTVEDQVELARRISHSLSDISNQQSKGQSMYVNRKKRSVKWVHEGDGKAEVQQYNGFSEETKENSYQSMTSSTSVHHEKIPLKLLMNPRGQVQDMSTVPHQGFSIDCGLLSPDKCAELVTALHAPKGKGAELFAKRRKKSEKWIVDECSAATRSPSGLPYGRPTPTSPIVPAYSDLGVHRVQLNMHQDLVQDKYAQPRLKLVKTPWDAALETGSASAAFQDVRQPPKEEFGTSAAASYDYYQPDEPKPQYQAPPAQKFPMSKPVSNSQRDLAYKPSIPQGWNAPRADLPKGLYIPPEIPLDSYVPPPVQQPLLPPTKPYQQQLPIYVEPPAPSSFPTTYQPTPQLPIEQPAANFPITAKPSYAYQPGQQYAKQLQSNYLATSNKVKNASPTPFNPSPLSYDKLAKFEQSSADQYQTYSMPPLRKPLAVPANTKIRNTSPTPFGASPTFGSKAPNYIAPRAGPQMPAPTTVQQQQPQYQPQPQTQYQPPPQSQYQQPPPPQPREVQQPFYPPPEDNYYNKPNTNFNVGRVPSVDLSHCQNYNTAPRGWNQRSDYYRPITFSKGSTELPYTDF